MKVDDGIEYALIEPTHTYLRNLNDDTGDTLDYFSTVSSPVNQRIESYWTKFAVDRPGWWKSFLQDMDDLENLIQVNPLYWIVSGFALWVFYEKNLQTLQMNRIHIYFRQTETTPHLVDPTLCTFYPIFMELQTVWSALTLAKPTNLLLPALYPLTSLMSLVSMQRHWWMNNTEMSHDASSTFGLKLYLLSKIEEYI